MRKVIMKKIALLAMLCVFSIVGAQSVQAVEDKNIDVKSHPQMERRHEHYKFENEGLTKKEIEKRKKEHKKWEEQKKKDWEKRKKQKEKNKKQWEKNHKKYGDVNRPNWDKNKKHNSYYGERKHYKYAENGKYFYGKKHPYTKGQMMNKGERHHNQPHFKQHPYKQKSMPRHYR